MFHHNTPGNDNFDRVFAFENFKKLSNFLLQGSMNLQMLLKEFHHSIYSQELLQEVIQVILSSSLNSKKCWVAPLSELRDLVKSFASFLNFPFQSEDSLRRKIFTYTAYSYECLLNVFTFEKPHLSFDFYLQNLLI